MGGFFVRDPYRPLGEVWIDGRAVRHEPVARALRTAARLRGQRRRRPTDRRARARARDPAGDLLQAGPLLVADGAVAFDPDDRPRGLLRRRRAVRLGHHEERHPRAALGLSDDALVAVACDGRRSASTRGSRCSSSRT